MRAGVVDDELQLVREEVLERLVFLAQTVATLAEVVSELKRRVDAFEGLE
jgi:hypothetical protein